MLTHRSAFTLGLLAALGALTAWALVGVLSDVATIITYLLVAVFLALGLDPPVRWLTRHHVRRGWAVLIVFAGLLTVAALIGLAVVPPLITQVQNLIAAAPHLLDSLQHNPLLQQLDHRYHLTREQGKPLPEARAEVTSAIGQLTWFGQEARRQYGRVVPAHGGLRRMVLTEPIGPVAAFTPWNYPVLLGVRKIAPALAAGCSMLLKPAEEAPTVLLTFIQALVDAGLPPGALNVVTGTPAAISERVLRSDAIRKLSFTGSVPVGQHLARLAADNVLDLSLELGGHAPVIVFDDVDPTAAGKRCAEGKFRNGGQICISPTRFYVHERIAQEFTRSFTSTTAALRVGDGADPDTDVGPLCHPRQVARVTDMVADATCKGAHIQTGGSTPPWADRGYYYSPTVLTDVPPEANILHDEPFGPVAPILTFDDTDQVLGQANASPYGLAGYVFTHHTSTAFQAVEELDVGIVGVNTFAVSSESLPFGGTKHSGIGRESGTEAMLAYTTSKAVSLDLAW